MKLITAFAIAMFTAATILNADAESIGINFTGNTVFLQPTDQPGVVPGSNWNNVNGASGNSITLNNSTGSLTTGLLSFASALAVDGVHPPATPNAATNLLYRGELVGNNSIREVSINLSNIPFTSYDIYVYASQNAGITNTLSITNGITTFYYRGAGQTNDNATHLIETTSTDPSDPTSGAAQYQVFRGLTASSFDLVTGGSIGNVISNNVFGLQVVSTAFSVPIPTSAPSISLFPAANRSAISTFAGSFLAQYGNQFSPDSRACLMANASFTAPLVEPLSGKNLKNSISNGLASVFETTATAISTTQATISLALGQMSPDEAVLTLALPYMIDKSNKPAFIAASIAKDALEAIPEAKVNPAAAAVGFLFGLNATIYGDILAPQLREYGQDPVDPNYLKIFQPTIDALAFVPATGNAQLDAALKQQTLALEMTAAYLQAVNASFDKYAGAIQAGDNIHATLQMEALLNYLHLYDQSAQDAAAAAKATQDLLTLLGMGNGTYDPQQLINLQSQIAANGLPSDILSLMTQLGLSSAQMSQVQQDILGLNPNAFSGTLADANAAAEATLLQGSSVPEPTAAALLLGGISLLVQRNF